MIAGKGKAMTLSVLVGGGAFQEHKVEGADGDAVTVLQHGGAHRFAVDDAAAAVRVGGDHPQVVQVFDVEVAIQQAGVAQVKVHAGGGTQGPVALVVVGPQYHLQAAKGGGQHDQAGVFAGAGGLLPGMVVGEERVDGFQ